jgi:hypothetical protein
MLGETLAAWIALPAVAVVLAVGLSLLLERATGHRLGALRVPVGLCAAVCITLGLYWVHLPGPVAAAAIGLPALAGIALEWRELANWRPGWMTIGWLAAYGFQLAPVILSGEWTWAGYNFVNDTATQMLLADYLTEHGMATPDTAQVSTATEFVRVYFDGAYPVGSHGLLGTLHEFVRIPLAALYQPYIAVLAASGGIALAQLARRAGLPAAAAAATAVLAVGANLFYQYALQGNVKEIAFFMALSAAAAAGRELVVSDKPLRASAATAICFAAAFEIYSAAAAAYLLTLGLMLAAAALWRRRATVAQLATAGAALAAGALVLAIPGLVGAITFNRVASGVFATENRAADLGQLLRPLEKIQVAGVWLSGEYRLPVPPGREWLSVALCILVGLLVVVGVAWSLRRREPATLIVLGTTLIAALYLMPRLSPYAEGKVLALASPVVVLGAAVGAWAVAKRWAWAGGALAAAVAVGILWSDALAYHDVKLAPIERMEALADVGGELKRTHGLVLVNEPEEFAKFFNGGTRFNTATEAITPRQIHLRKPQNFQSLYFDLDDQVLSYVEGFPAIVKRRSPSASRPPANYQLVYANRWYEAWVRDSASPRVLAHLPLQAVQRATTRPACDAVLELAGRARRGDLLVAARQPQQVMLDTADARRSPGWAPHSWQPGMVVPSTPGAAEARVRVERPGRYRAWVAGSFTRPIEASVDGEGIGAAGGVNNLGQWLPAGTVALSAGEHELELSKPGGGLSPGDGYDGELGPLVLEPLPGGDSLERVEPKRARSLCGRAWDWIELVRPRSAGSGTA